MRRYLYLGLALLLWTGGSAWNHASVDYRALKARKNEPATVALPRPEVAKIASLGFDAFLADLYWVGGVNYFGDFRNEKVYYAGLYPYMDLVTELAPEFRSAYRFGGSALPWNTGERWVNVPEAVRLLEKGIARFPGDYFLRMLVAYDYSAYLKNYKAAAEHLAKAAGLPGAPAYLPSLATRLYVAAGEHSAARLLAEEVYRVSEDPEVKEVMRLRYGQVIIEEHLQEIAHATAMFRERAGRLPSGLDELVRAGDLEAIPQEPFGGEYVFDPLTGKARSNTPVDRLQLHVKSSSVGTR